MKSQNTRTFPVLLALALVSPLAAFAQNPLYGSDTASALDYYAEDDFKLRTPERFEAYRQATLQYAPVQEAALAATPAVANPATNSSREWSQAQLDVQHSAKYMAPKAAASGTARRLDAARSIPLRLSPKPEVAAALLANNGQAPE